MDAISVESSDALGLHVESMRRTIISAIALGVFLLADGVSAEPAALAQNEAEAASTSPDSSSPEQAQYGFWCYDSYWGWYRC